MPSTHESARALARRLIELEESRPRSHPSVESAPLEVCYRLHLILCTSVGTVGCNTLVARALRAAEARYPALEEMSVGVGTRPYFERVPEAIETYDTKTVAAAVEGFVEALLELLTRLVGDDVVAAMVQQTAAADSGEPIEIRDTS